MIILMFSRVICGSQMTLVIVQVLHQLYSLERERAGACTNGGGAKNKEMNHFLSTMPDLDPLMACTQRIRYESLIRPPNAI